MEFHIVISTEAVRQHYWTDVKNSGELPFAFEDAMRHFRQLDPLVSDEAVPSVTIMPGSSDARPGTSVRV